MLKILKIVFFWFLLTNCRKAEKSNFPVPLSTSPESKITSASFRLISAEGECYLVRAGVTRRLDVKELLQVFDFVGTERGKIHLQLQEKDFFLGDHSELFIDRAKGNDSDFILPEISSGKLGINAENGTVRIRIGKNILQAEKGIYTVLHSRSIQIHNWEGGLEYFRENEKPIRLEEGSYLVFKGSDYTVRSLASGSEQRILRLISVFKVQESKEIYKYLYDSLQLKGHRRKKEKKDEKSKLSEAVNDEPEAEKIDLSRYIPLRKDDAFRNNHLKIDGL